jgi:hypothetical protein
LELRRELPRGDVDDVRYEDGPGARWLRVRRGQFELACNFAAEPAGVRVEGDALVLATHEGVALRDGLVELPALAGALVR